MPTIAQTGTALGVLMKASVDAAVASGVPSRDALFEALGQAITRHLDNIQVVVAAEVPVIVAASGISLSSNTVVPQSANHPVLGEIWLDPGSILLETLTADPASPLVGEIWVRTDL